MKKDKEWLKEEIKKLITEESQYMPHGEMVDLGLVLLTIDQLDEPEVLSKELPAIPKFVADWIEEAKDRKLTLYGAIHECPREVDYWLVDGDSSNQETFARAWLDGYEVEKEKKYYVAFEDINLLYVTHVEVCGENEKLNYSSESSTENAMKFIDKEKASSLAYFLDAIVVEATQ